MVSRELSVVLGGHGCNRAFKTGRVTLPQAQLRFVEVEPLPQAFRRMCRSLEFDVCEMAVTTYLVARNYGLPITAIPFFPLRMVPTPVMGNMDAGVAKAKDFEGRTVGVRAYTVTAGVWARDVLSDVYGVELNKVQWLLGDEEHVADFHRDAPPNTTYRPGAKLDQMLLDGEIAGVIGSALGEAGPIGRVISRDKELAWAQSKRINPINHTVVIRDEVIEQWPELPGALYEALIVSRDIWLEEVGTTSALDPIDEELIGRRPWFGNDLLPEGLTNNAATMDELTRTMRVQGIPYLEPWKASFVDLD